MIHHIAAAPANEEWHTGGFIDLYSRGRCGAPLYAAAGDVCWIYTVPPVPTGTSISLDNKRGEKNIEEHLGRRFAPV